METPNTAEQRDYVQGLLAETLSRDRRVDRIVFDPSAIMLYFFEDGPMVYLRIASSFEFRRGGERQALNPELGGSTLQPALALLRARMLDASVAASGGIRIEFQHGLSIDVPPNPRYEAWEVEAEEWFKVVCMPGGTFAAWTDTVSNESESAL